MQYLDFDSLYREIVKILTLEKSIMLATSSDNKVTVRAMSHVADGIEIMFQTDKNSEKALQIKQNPNVAFAVSNIQIEAAAYFCGHPLEQKNVKFIHLYQAKFPEYFKRYSCHSDEILIKCSPTKISLYKYISGSPCKDILDVASNCAYRLSK